MKFINLSSNELTILLLCLGCLLLSAFVFGKLFEKLSMPRVIGEIFGGFILGVSGLHLLMPEVIQAVFMGFESQSAILGSFYQLGLIFLMFVAGFNTQLSFKVADIKLVFTLFISATFIPAFFGFMFIDFFKPHFIGENGDDLSFAIVFLISIAVTSIPVISKIFFDIGIIQSRFASVVLTSSTLQDLFLWIFLNIAINRSLNQDLPLEDNLWVAFWTIFLFVFVKLTAHFSHHLKMKISQKDFLTLGLILLLLVCAVLQKAHINPMYSAFLTGFLLKNIAYHQENLQNKMESVSDFAFSFFIPIYFALIGIGLNVGGDFSMLLFAVFCILACALEFIGTFVGLFALKLSMLSRLSFAITMNARGGPGIVLASTGLYYSLINLNFFTTLILTTLFSSALAGYYLRFLKSKKGIEIFNQF